MDLNEWADLYGEWDPQPERPHGKDAIWCVLCEDWIERDELKRWTGDDALHWLCPGCDSDLLPVESME